MFQINLKRVSLYLIGGLFMEGKIWHQPSESKNNVSYFGSSKVNSRSVRNKSRECSNRIKTINTPMRIIDNPKIQSGDDQSFLIDKTSRYSRKKRLLILDSREKFFEKIPIGCDFTIEPIIFKSGNETYIKIKFKAENSQEQSYVVTNGVFEMVEMINKTKNELDTLTHPVDLKSEQKEVSNTLESSQYSYTTIQSVGAGAYGDVILAEQRPLTEDDPLSDTITNVAIKSIRRDKMSLDQLLSEIVLLKQTGLFLDFIKKDNHYYIVMKQGDIDLETAISSQNEKKNQTKKTFTRLKKFLKIVKNYKESHSRQDRIALILELNVEKDIYKVRSLQDNYDDYISQHNIDTRIDRILNKIFGGQDPLELYNQIKDQETISEQQLIDILSFEHERHNLHKDDEDSFWESNVLYYDQISFSNFLSPTQQSSIQLTESDHHHIFYQLSEQLYKNRVLRNKHGDIKPANIMLKFNESEIDALLIDWGSGTKLGEPPGPGTPLYEPPEETVEGVIDKADIFSLGAVMHDLIFNCHVSEKVLEFNDKRVQKIRVALLEKRDFNRYIEFLTNSDNKLHQLVGQCLSYDPNQRIGFSELKNQAYLLVNSSPLHNPHVIDAKHDDKADK
ncbi:hypothetical protein DID75_01560 [Candidatus Marinamargulisbacteria bacterium SCGC AG-410-N11]|nr:hypothetical protein DID75_01560 [Candidatus Marinamargulisbacteria bacterium SCGC AG-410-N11]